MTNPVQDILDALEGVRQHGPDKWSARCPAHEDKHASLTVSRGREGRALLYCHAGCGAIQVTQALGLPMGALFPPRENRRRAPGGSSIVAEYNYRDADGTLLFQVVRFDPKDFRQRRPDADRPDGDAWAWNLDGVRRVLYRLPQLLQTDPAAWVFVVEGEKDAEALADLGLTATCNAGGAGKWAAKVHDDTPLEGRRVAIIPDADAPGQAHANEVARCLLGRAADLRIVTLPDGVKDVSDWLVAGGAADALVALTDATPPFDPAAAPAVTVALGERDPGTGRLVLSPKRTLPTAKAFTAEFYRVPSSGPGTGGPTLIEYGGLFYEWRDNRYVELQDDTLRQRLQPWLHDAVRYVTDRNTKELTVAPYESNPATVNAALESVRSKVHLPAATPRPSWLDEAPARPPVREVLPCKTANLHIPSGRLLPATPALFTTTALEFDYDPDAPDPAQWRKFLGELWGGDYQSVALLQEWFGYCLTQDTSQQKMMLLVGPKRSGKGTIAHVLTALVGRGNTCGPTVNGLCTQFGLAPLVDKSLAVISDARFQGERIGILVELLLCVSGEDRVTVDRKYLPAVTMQLPTRFMFLSNELPRLTEMSGALPGRFQVLRLTNSFYGREDLDLKPKLEAELPGILCWALDGWLRLQEQRRFTEPEASTELRDELDELSSPIQAFVNECCEQSDQQRVASDTLYAAYIEWCKREGRGHPVTRGTFGRDLRAVIPKLGRHRNRAAGGYWYEGIGLLPQPGGGPTLPY